MTFDVAAWVKLSTARSGVTEKLEDKEALLSIASHLHRREVTPHVESVSALPTTILEPSSTARPRSGV